MTRKLMRVLIVCLVNLAILPGCQILSPQHKANSEDARIRQELATAKEAAARQPGVPAKEPRPRTNATPAAPVEQPTLESLPPISEPLGGPKLDVSKIKNPPGSVETQTVNIAKHEASTDPATVKFYPVQVGKDPPPPPLLVEKQKPVKRMYAPCVEAIQSILDKHEQEAIKHLEAYDKDTQEFFLRILPMLAVFAEKRLDELNAEEIGKVNEQMIGLLTLLRPRSQLTIGRMCFCKKVRGFGDLEPLPENHAFQAGAQDRLGELVQLYVELKNFCSEPTPDANYVTKLACTLELRDAVKGAVVWSYTYDRSVTTHRRQTRLNDFYSNFSFYVPPVAPGAYQLTIQIADETNPERVRTVSKSLDFRVTPVGEQPR